MTKILQGKPVADKIQQRIEKNMALVKKAGKKPTLGVIRMGNNPNDLSYEKALMRKCKEYGIGFHVKELVITETTETLVKAIEDWNKNDIISGIIVFRPLPKHIDDRVIRLAIDPKKDVDCMHPMNLARIFEGDMEGIVPATPAAVIEFIRHYQIPVEGKQVVIVNRSLVFGRPLAMMLLNLNACPMLCHSRTLELDRVCREADVVVLATGQAKKFNRDYFTEDSIILDVGVSTDAEGKLSGDLDFENLDGYVKMMTPVKGGIGSTTTAILLEQVIRAAKQR